MTKVEKLPSGSYRVRVYNKYEKRQVSFTAQTEKEAKVKAFEYELSIGHEAQNDYTVKDVITMYIDNRSAVLSPSTLSVYKKLAKNNYKSLDDLFVSKLNSEMIQRFINSISIDHSPKTVRNVYGLLISSIRSFYPEKHYSVTLPAKKPIERHIPTNDDIKELLENASGDLRKAILLASVGTLRRGECCALRYEDIKGNVIHVHADMVQTPDKTWIYKDMPKNASSDRYIEFPPEVIKALGKGDGYIITINPNSVTKAFERLRAKLGLSCRFHDLRHYAASIMHYLGVPDVYIMERGGWASDTILKQVYRNVLSDKSKEFSQKTNEYMGKFIGQFRD